MIAFAAEFLQTESLKYIFIVFSFSDELAFIFYIFFPQGLDICSAQSNADRFL